MEEQIRQILPEKVRQAFDDIVEQRVLGASKHIAMIGEMFEAIDTLQTEDCRNIKNRQTS